MLEVLGLEHTQQRAKQGLALAYAKAHELGLLLLGALQVAQAQLLAGVQLLYGQLLAGLLANLAQTLQLEGLQAGVGLEEEGFQS